MAPQYHLLGGPGNARVYPYLSVLLTIAAFVRTLAGQEAGCWRKLANPCEYISSASKVAQPEQQFLPNFFSQKNEQLTASGAATKAADKYQYHAMETFLDTFALFNT